MDGDGFKVGCSCLGTMLWLSFVGFLIWAAIHFILKFW